MTTSSLFAALLLIGILAWWLGYSRSLTVAKSLSGSRLHSRPQYHGSFNVLMCVLPALIVLGGWLFFDELLIQNMMWASLPEHYHLMADQEKSLVANQIASITDELLRGGVLEPSPLVEAAQYRLSLESRSQLALSIFTIVIAIGGMSVGLSLIRRDFMARNKVEGFLMFFLLASSFVAILTTVGIILSVSFESVRFFQAISPAEFLFGTHWSPQIAIRADQVGSSGGFGAVPLFIGTLLISFIAMLLAAPVGLMSAIYLSEYALPGVRKVVKPILEILAGIPTVVYGFFAAITVAPFFRDMGMELGLTVSSESALVAGIVMGIMIIPFISSISDDVIHAVPQAMRDGSYGLGATKSETIRRVIIPAALPGIVGGMMLAISRAIGETMIVVMAAGLAANLTANPLESVTTVTVQIVTLLTGDQEFDSPKTLAAFALGLVLFVTTLILNIFALHIVNKYREQYE